MNIRKAKGRRKGAKPCSPLSTKKGKGLGKCEGTFYLELKMNGRHLGIVILGTCWKARSRVMSEKLVDQPGAKIICYCFMPIKAVFRAFKGPAPVIVLFCFYIHKKLCMCEDLENHLPSLT